MVCGNQDLVRAAQEMPILLWDRVPESSTMRAAFFGFYDPVSLPGLL
jgi:hypothetical protein